MEEVNQLKQGNNSFEKIDGINENANRGQIEFLAYLEGSDLDLLRNMVTTLEEGNIDFSENCKGLRETITINLSQQLKEESLNSPMDYFGLGADFFEVDKCLREIGLDIFQLLNQYKEFIETELDGIDDTVKQKVKTSIANRIKMIVKEVNELKEDEVSNYGNLERFSENRWIINNKIQDNLSFVNKELLPSLKAYTLLKNGAKFSEKHQNPFLDIDMYSYDFYSYPNFNPDYIDKNSILEEIEELMNADVDEDGDFVERGFGLYTQQIFDLDKNSHSSALNELGIKEIDITTLSPEDLTIERNATYCFLALIAAQIGVETLGGPVGMVIGGCVDIADVFSDSEMLIEIGKILGFIPDEYRMEKTWVDNLLAAVGLIPGGTQLIKSGKLGKLAAKFGFNLDDLTKAGMQMLSKLGDMKIGKVDNVVDVVKTFSKSELDRIKQAETLLGITLSQKQSEAIIKAHNIGNIGKEGGYPLTDLLQKARILDEAGFDIATRRKLLEEGICGVESNVPINSEVLKGLKGEPKEQVDILYTFAYEGEKEFANLVSGIADMPGLKGKCRIIPEESMVSIKSPQTAYSKFITEYKGENINEMKDILRATLVYDNFSDFVKSIKSLEGLTPDIIVFYANTKRLSIWGTCDTLVQIRLSNGLVTELQFHIKQIYEAKEIGRIVHPAIVPKWTNKDFDIVEKLKTLDPEKARILNMNVKLPMGDKPIPTHDLYEIMRSISSALNSYEKGKLDLTLHEVDLFKSLYSKLDNLQTYINKEAIREYDLLNPLDKFDSKIFE